MTDLSLYLQEVDAVLISSTSQITFLTGYSNFSSTEREAYLLITPEKKYIFTDARYTEAVKNLADFELLEISGKVGFSDHLKNLSEKHQIKNIGIEEYSLTVRELRNLEKIFNDIKSVKLGSLRSIKTKEEINKIEKACLLGDKGFRVLLKKIKPGISEKELALEFELFIKKNGATLSFDTIVAFGENTAIPHHHTGGQKIEDRRQIGEDGKWSTEALFIKMDFGTKVDNYCSDMTRTVFYGKASAKQKKMYQTVLDAQTKVAEFLDNQIKQGKKVLGKEVDKVARDYIIAQGFPSIPHGLGHGTGIEVHEAPRLSPKSDDELVEGMVFSIEPGIYIPGYGGVRIEDLYVIEKNGLRQFTKSKKDLMQI